MELKDDDPTLSKLITACYDLRNILQPSATLEASLEEVDKRFVAIQDFLTVSSRKIAPLQTLSIANRALDTRINRAIDPALVLLESFKLSSSLQTRLLDLDSKLSNETVRKKRLKKLIEYVDCVDNLNRAIDSISHECEPAIQKLQEVVEFLSRTKATDQYRTQRLRETLITLKGLYQTEVDAMKFEGLLDEALMKLQDEFESLLQQLRHQINVDEVHKDDNSIEVVVLPPTDLGTRLEIVVLARISNTLATNDCLDICIDIYIQVRYRRAAKALMRLNPDYLRTYTPEEIDAMDWESLETAISLWTQHIELSVRSVLVTEKTLCSQVLGCIREGILVWPECFTKIADKIMAVFFRFGEGVARSNKEPQKLFKLLDMYNSLKKLKQEFSVIFEGEAGTDICSRFRELEKLLVHASTKVFWEFGLRIEGNQDGPPPPQDGSVPKLVRYAINYLKYLASDIYSAPMTQVLRIEQSWKAGILSVPEAEDDHNLLKDAITNVMEAIQRNVESKKGRYNKDKALSNIFVMNTYWYIYMRSRNSDLGKFLGDQYLKNKYKLVAEESAYLYQKQAWGNLIKQLQEDNQGEGEDGEKTLKRVNKDAIGAIARGKMEAFMKSFDKIMQKHRNCYRIPDPDLRDQIREATVRFVVPAYTEFLRSYSSFLAAKTYLSYKTVEGLLSQIFEGTGAREEQQNGDRRSISAPVENSREDKPIRRTTSSTADA